MSNSCTHKRRLVVNAKASDMQNYSVPHLDLEHDGYAPNISGLCQGDYINFSVCLDCGQVVGFQPMSDVEVAAVISGEEIDE